MTPAVFETTKVDFDLGRFVFRATGSRMLFDGYHVLYHEAHEPEEGKTLEDLPPIPPLVEGDVVTVKQITPNQHFTEPPPRYSEASLVKELERLGIGRPSTYATIISTLKARWYATAKDRRFAPTPLGETVWRVMKRSFPAVFDVGFTAQMENELDKVEEGDLGWQQVLGDFWGPFSKALDAVDVQQLIHDVHDLSELHKEKCPTCGSGDLAERRTKKGRNFFGCLRYPECDYSVWNKPVAVACPACGFVGMEERQSKTEGATRKCLKCGHEVPVAEATPAESVAM